MRTKKVTLGEVVQTFNDKGKCIEQEFVAGDQVEWVGDNLEPLDDEDRIENCEYQPFHMVQPQAMAVALVGNISDGFRAVGPFEDFDEASRWADGQESWLMTMQSPYEEFDSVKIPVIGTVRENGQVELNRDST